MCGGGLPTKLPRGVPTSRPQDTNGVLHEAAAAGHAAAVGALLDAGVHPDTPGQVGRPYATPSGHGRARRPISCVGGLRPATLRQLADVNCQPSCRCVALRPRLARDQLPARRPRPTPRPPTQQKRGATALHAAVAANHADVARVLLRRGAAPGASSLVCTRGGSVACHAGCMGSMAASSTSRLEMAPPHCGDHRTTARPCTWPLLAGTARPSRWVRLERVHRLLCGVPWLG